MSFQCSSASRKFLNAESDTLFPPEWAVSVLFSEPKIPQLRLSPKKHIIPHCFSALQRAENSSIDVPPRVAQRAQSFQCSSASRKFLNLDDERGAYAQAQVSVLFSEPKIPQCGIKSAPRRCIRSCFSALQRAENSSIDAGRGAAMVETCFSALQRAENSSIGRLRTAGLSAARVSVLFSEPKIPQC